MPGTCLKETGRNVVGNGDQCPRGWWAWTWWEMVILRYSRSTRVERISGEKASQNNGGNSDSTEASTHASLWERTIGKVRVGSPFRVLLHKDNALTLWMAASAYANYHCIQASNPLVYKDIYHFNELEIGLAYYPGSAGVVLSIYANEKLMDRNYVVAAKEIGHEIDQVTGDDLKIFPIERARVRSCWISPCHLIVQTDWISLGSGKNRACEHFVDPSILAQLCLHPSLADLQHLPRRCLPQKM